MKDLKNCLKVWLIPIISFVVFLVAGCDSGKEAVDDITGNKAVKQYQKSKKDIDKIVEKQSQRLNNDDDEMEKELSEGADEE